MESDAPHIPVMLDEVLAALDAKPGEHIIDGTFGAGGYSRAILATGASVTGFDRDPNAVRDAKPMIDEFSGRLNLIEAPFSIMADHFEPGSIDAIVLDIGVSSMQLDQAERGFSFRFDGPLDMRMAQSGVSAADVVNHASVSDLTRIIGILGEEKQASRVARAIVAARDAMPMKTTGDLAKVIERAIPRKATDKIHPATRSFQGLRIFVNDELRELARALFAAETLLREGGRLVVVTFHSLEDRIVKKFIQDRSTNPAQSRHMPAAHGVSLTFAVPGKVMVAASDAEAERNPRARSAKLRMAVRTAAAPRAEDFSIFGLPNLPWPNTAGGAKTSIGGRAR